MQLLNDIRRFEELSYEKKIYLLSFLIAVSGVLSVIDTMIPKPVPLAKIGIANIVTLILVLESRYKMAFTVGFFRTLISAVMVGSFLTYTYLLSLTGAMVSVFLTVLFFHFFRKRFSEIGLSVIGAFFNTASQGLVVFLFFGLDRGTIFLVSLFILISALNGLFIGVIVRMFYKRVHSAIDF